MKMNIQQNMARWVSTEWDKSKDSEESGGGKKNYKEIRSKSVNIKIQQLCINKTKIGA